MAATPEGAHGQVTVQVAVLPPGVFAPPAVFPSLAAGAVPPPHPAREPTSMMDARVRLNKRFFIISLLFLQIMNLLLFDFV
ncbi:hypothetical protein ANACOL_04067 [Anaerotruncus colihominis DSM 17241]|uniref:Uncharacterized protein n=1 Tax=Anaerotruncus colihominis DSM 17241 TaxID=445972 RepID=B0PH44_9FIRM|nr:hypothetical protein ANACOL_04067 [Anaerotruncus colihominis DSM 17241]